MTLQFVKYENGCLLLRTDDPDMAFLEKFRPGKYEIVKYREKRSSTANAYMWALCGEIGDVLGLSKEEVYRNAVREGNVYRDFHNMTEDEAKTLAHSWGLLGTGWFTERQDFEPDGEHLVIRAYYGSSTYNTRQMSRLIDRLVQDAKSVGIETADEEYIRGLLEEYERQLR